MTRYVHLNGELVPEADAHVGIDDGGWLHGAGLFETMRAENGRIFRLESHMERLMRSAAKLLRPVDREQLPGESDFRTLLERNELTTARVRLTVSAGSMRAEPEADEPGLTVCVTASELLPYPDKLYETGIDVVLADFRQSPSDPLAGHKTTSYLPRLLALRKAQRVRCMEAIWFTTNNHLAEGSISNVFIIREGVLKTPPLDTPVLPGIARGVVLEIARRDGLAAEECPLTINDLLDADEVFLTNTIMQVMPVIRIERHGLGDGRVGPATRRLRESYVGLVLEECHCS
jgi:branched-subunit amino acid aminotransferase/4-amino-4-deoxychorismate lyase